MATGCISLSPFRRSPAISIRLQVLVLPLLLAVFSSFTHSQTPQAVQETRDHEQFLAYWTTEASWHSELQLKNNQIDRDLTVVPVLRTPDGAETSLPAVTIKPQEVQLVDIGALAPQLRQTYGSVVLRYNASASRGLYAAVMIHDMGHPIALHLDAVDAFPGTDPGSREGVWWLPKDTTSDYLVLTNQGNNPMHLALTLYDASGKEIRQRLELGSRQTSRYSVRQLIQSAGLSGTYGGVKISAGSNGAFLDTVHFLFDEQAGFSAILKMFDHEPNAKIERRDLTRTGVWTLRAPMLALSQPDPTFGFPEDAVLQPQIFVRNTTGNPVVASLRFNWRGDNTTGNASGPTVQLAPFQTRRFDVAALQDGKILPKEAHWAVVILTTKGIPDEVMAVAASYDESLRYGAQTPFNDQLSFHWEGGMWEYDVQHDSVITVGNGGSKPTRAAFTIFYNQGKDQYQLEQTLQPDAQMWVQVGKLIREQLPDKDGKTLPPNLTSGSYQIRDLTHSGTGTLFEGKVIYDKTYGNVAYGCSGQCCYVGARLINNPLGIPFQGTTTNGVNGNDNCGFTDNVSTDFWGNWKTANQSIATVDAHGMHTGAGAGSTTSNTQGKLLSPYGRYQCTNQGYSPSGGDNVQKPDHLYVLTDTQFTPNCGSGPSSLVRKITYEVLDTTNNRMQVPFLLKENVPTNIVSSCNGGVVQTGATCTSNVSYYPGALGEFQDFLSPGCPSSQNVVPCGFQFANQQWEWCPGVGAPASIGTIGPVNVQNTIINVDGNILGFTPGKTFPK
jgi:hypothetical protein